MDILKKYFPELNNEQYNQFEKLGALYVEWNARINVISRKDIDQLYTHHVLHSLAIAKIISFAPQSRILDVGTGGGFPGIPLAIMFPLVRFHLVDSIGKKIKVVQAIVDSLQLKNVLAEQNRVENLKDTYDFIVSRGVTRLAELYRWNAKNISNVHKNTLSNGIICLKGGDQLLEEIAEVHTHVKTWSINDFFEEGFFESKKVVYVKKK